MKIFYGWIVVGAGIVITCLGMGTMMSLGIFLQPMLSGNPRLMRFGQVGVGDKGAPERAGPRYCIR